MIAAIVFAVAASGMAAPQAGIAMPPQNLHALVARELATPGRYHLAVAAPPAPVARPWWTVAVQWVWDRLARLWQAAFARVRLGRGGAVAIGDLLIAAVALIVLVAAFRVAVGLRRERRSATPSIRALAPPPDARALYERACACARRGEYAAASRLLFAATIAALDLSGVVPDDRSATVGDVRRTLGARDAQLIGRFDAVASAFAAAAYAERTIQTIEWERARDAYRAIAGEANA